MTGTPERLDVETLRGLAILEGVDGLEGLAPRLSARPVVVGETLMDRGDEPSFFLLVVDATVQVIRGDTVTLAGPGSIIGELGVASGRPRRATVVVSQPGTIAIGGGEAFSALLALPGARRRIRDVAAARLAAGAAPVSATLGDGTGVLVRPLLPSDREVFASEVHRLSAESLRRRFFSSAEPSESLIDYLVEVDYVDHFAWAVADLHEPTKGLASARYVRSGTDPTAAEVAFGVVEGMRSRGIGTLLLGALAAAATRAGIETFTAEVLGDNEAMKAVLRKAEARFHPLDADTVQGELAVATALDLIAPQLVDGLTTASAEVVTAAGLALVVA